MDLQIACKEMDETIDEEFGRSNDEVDIANFATAAPHRHNHEVGTSAGATGSEEE